MSIMDQSAVSRVSFTAVAIVLCLVQIASSGIPREIQKCRAGDVKCIANTTNEILHRYPNGNKELGLVQLDPVHLDEVVVAKRNDKNPLSLDLRFKSLEVVGLSKTIVHKAVGFEKDPTKSKFEMHATIPELILRGQYMAEGKILLLPIYGKGNAVIRFKNFNATVKAKFNAVDESGKTRLSIAEIKGHCDPEFLTVKLENLFNGNKELGDQINKVINQNWRDIWTELEDGINDAVIGVIKHLISHVIQTITYDEYFLD